MIKNLLFIIVDSMSYDRIYSSDAVSDLTPFLNSIKSDSLFFTNLFSQGPYTEAGTKGLLCSCDTLDNGGYYLRYDSQPKFITDFFKDCGFITYNVNSPWYLLSKRTLNNIDYNYYTSCFDCRFLWSQRFVFYYKKWQAGLLTEDDYKYLISFVDLMFDTSCAFFDSENFIEQFRLIERYINKVDFESNVNIIKREKAIYCKNKKAYIDSVFIQKTHHPIFDIKNKDMDNMINTSLVNKVFDNHKSFLSNFRKTQFFKNLINNHCKFGTFGKVAARVFCQRRINKTTFGEYFNRLRNIASFRETIVYKTGHYFNGDPYKLSPSARTQIDFAINLLETNRDEKKFVFIHPEEPHYFNTFFTYDTNDEKLLDSEINYADDYLRTIKKNYKGSLFYDLSIRYIDKQIERLYQKLKEDDLLDSTMVVITADHGSSYFFEPIRQTLVNNMHSENYHIPLYIFGGGVKGRIIDTLGSNKDVIPTIFELCNCDIPKCAKGKSLLRDLSEQEAITIEYMGPGCPDIRLKPVWISARSLYYSVCFISSLSVPFDEKNITEIYDLVKDPKELKNIRKQRNSQIINLINTVRFRFNELRKENKFDENKN